MAATLSQPVCHARTSTLAPVGALTIAELARRSHEESSRYWGHETYDERPGHELFRRAIVEGNDAAWAAIYAQYAGMVRRWLMSREEDDEAVVEVFERFWHAMDAAKFAHFTSLAAILRYLRACASSVRSDLGRKARQHGETTALDETLYALPAHDNVEDTVCEIADGKRLWAIVCHALSDEREREVAYLSYVAGLTPRDIYARHAARYADIAEVYRLKRAALSRLSRSQGLRMLLAS